MPKQENINLAVGIGTCLLTLFMLVVLILHERDHDHTDYTGVVMTMGLLSILLLLTAWSVYVNLKDARRARNLHAQIVAIKEEYKLQTKAAEEYHAGELRRLKTSHEAYLWREREANRICEKERREALDKIGELETRSASFSLASKLTIHAAFYGNTPENEVSVLPKLISLPKDAFAIYVTNNNVDADPAPNIPPKKRLRVRYSYGNDTIFETYSEEGEWMTLPDPTNRRREIS
jgi:hypothetical protein